MIKALEGAAVGRVEDDLVKLTFAANRLQSSLAGHFELALYPRPEPRNEIIGSGRSRKRRLDATTKDYALDSIGALQCERQHDRTLVQVWGRGRDDSIGPAAGRDFNRQNF